MVDMQVLDCDYVMVNNKPIARLFGKTLDGKTTCAFFNGKLPYFYLHVPKKSEMFEVMAELENAGMAVTTADKFLPVGYQEKTTKLLKITGTDPSKIPEMKDFAKKYGTPYEADILYKYRFMIDNKIKGFDWINVDGKQEFTKTVKCRAIEATSFKPIEAKPDAPLRYLALDIECVTTENRIVEAESDPIIMISFAFNPEYKGKKTMVIVAKPHASGEDVFGFSDEKEMMKKFLDIMDDYDPDIVTGYNINGFDFPYILKRLEVNQLPRSFGRTEKAGWSKKMAMGSISSLSGRVIVDPFEIIKNDPWIRFKRYDLRTVAKEMLGIEKLDVHGGTEMLELWNSKKFSDLKRFTDYCRRDSELALALVVDRGLLGKFVEMSKLSGLLLQDVLGGQTQRLECRLMHEFRDRNIVMPFKPEGEVMQLRVKEREEHALTGATVLEPETGFHTTGCTLVLDFKSLYPSLIAAYNICPTTLLLNNEDKEHFESPIGAKFVKPSVKEGVLPKMVKDFMDSRSAAKKEMKLTNDPERKKILNNKQLALKTLANSLYGYTSYLRAKLYVMEVAGSITSFGRDNIMKTKGLIEDKYKYKVIYGDTDSIFVKTDTLDLEQAEKIGNDIASFVTSQLFGLELQFEKLFKTFLILTKKRYAGLSFERNKDGGWKDKIEMKGIETVRRDWCELVTETMMSVLITILKEQDTTKASKYVRGIINDLMKGNISPDRLVVVKGITKSLASYDGVQPHVELAKKIMKRDPTRQNMVGERLGYVIIKGNELLSKRAEDPQYVKDNKLEIDSNHYLENQLLPPLERIFEACGIGKSELLEGSRQKSLFDMINAGKPLPPERTILKDFDNVSCKKCSWTFRRPTLTGICPDCGSQIFFSKDGSIGNFVELSKIN